MMAVLRPLISISFFFAFCTACWAQETDGAIYLHDYPNPNGYDSPELPDTVGPGGEGDMYIYPVPPDNYKPTPSTDPNIATKPTMNYVVYSRKLASWRDYLTLPRTRMACVKWAKGSTPFGSWKTCIGWKTQLQWMDNVMYLEVTVVNHTIAEIKQMANECFATGAVAGAATALVTGGSGAFEAFAETFKACIVVRLTTDLINISPRTVSRWSSWQ